ncbi:putative F-box family protein [Melia azedarach]|uniref:F-box family protein n=1 Tax=Melia azedarach TaxID=155640 RepID=A0ACC1XU59_MELAZ|nr:putative F-box family protein [Melia azedarach]
MESVDQTIKRPLTSMLPLDLIIDILSRLPVKTLLRFRCLSKFFRSLIDGPDFINLHLTRSLDTNSNLSLIFSGFANPDSRIFCGSLDSLDNCVEVDYPFRNCRYFRRYDTLVIGSCNGLVALHNREKGIVLLNPSTKKHRILPKFYSSLDDCYAYFDGFGYDASTDDFKLVRIIVFNNPLSTEVTVYSLKNNTWRRIGDFSYYFRTNRGNGVFASGALHWMATLNPQAEEDDLIIAFDLKREEFYQVPVPPSGKGRFFPCLKVLRGCLSLICTCDYKRPCELWVMKEYGMKDSWTKLFSFQLGAIIEGAHASVFAYSKSGDKVLVKQYGDHSWYDLQNQSLESILENIVEIDGKVRRYSDAILCVDSLVSPNAYTRTDC